MSVLIKGMKTPDSCADCYLLARSGTRDYCTITHKRVDYVRPKDCPLIEVPTHGRLVDIDEVYRVLTEYYHHATETQHTALREALSRVPIIVEGEEE